MKKMVLGLTLILLSVVFFLFDEIAHFSLFHTTVVQGIYIILPFVGTAFSVWGFLEKDR